MKKATYFRLVRAVAAALRTMGGSYYRVYSDKLTDTRRYRTKIAHSQHPHIDLEIVVELLRQRFAGYGVTISLQTTGQSWYAYPSIVIRPNRRLRAG